MTAAATFSHLDEAGRARMVDIGGKEETIRVAKATGRVLMAAETCRLVRAGETAKGDALQVARIAGIMAAKKVDSLIPLCHQLALTKVEIDFQFSEEGSAIDIEVTAATCGRTGVEMEALTAVSVAALTLYDMCKAVDKEMEITDIRLLQKSGGRSGDYTRKE